MPIKILMPALSPTMTEGNLAKWLKNEGDTVKAGDVIAEIETDKATMEVEAVDEGTLGKILVPGGTEGVKVNEPIALLLEEGGAMPLREAFEIVDAVDKGVVDGGYAWTHYWSGKNTAAGLFSNPAAGGGTASVWRIPARTAFTTSS